jgi:hypothetical protein
MGGKRFMFKRTQARGQITLKGLPVWMHVGNRRHTAVSGKTGRNALGYLDKAEIILQGRRIAVTVEIDKTGTDEPAPGVYGFVRPILRGSFTRPDLTDKSVFH